MYRTYFATAVAFCGLFALAGIHQGDARESSPGHHPPSRMKHGVAVWYGEDRQGKVMANGQTFDQWAMTGASVHFPLGTRVRITDVATHRSVIVTVTDYTIPKSRVLIDLSHGAGRALGIETLGKAHVEALAIGFDRIQTRAISVAANREPTDSTGYSEVSERLLRNQ
jgi:rare lipoprotein A